MSRKHQTLWLVAAIGCICPASTVGAQEIAMAEQRPPEETNVASVDTSAAVLNILGTMVDEAVALERPGHYLEAARLYEAAASMLPKGDPDSFEYQSRAGLLCYHAGELERALEVFEEIGRQATDLGNTEVASNAYERAMYIALEQGDKPKAATLYLRSLSQEERDELLKRRQ